MIPPSGEQVELVLDDQRATVVEVGGGLRSYVVGGRDVLDGYAVGEMCSAGRGQLLIPWPNRIQDGVYEFEGRTHRLPLTEPGRRNAIHGLVGWVSWRVGEREAHRVVMEHTLRPQPGYPFSLALSVEYELSAAGLTVSTTATNLGSEPCPYGAGAHPYLTLGTETIDELLLQIPAGTMLRADERGIPIGAAPVEGTEYDFGSPRPVGSTVLDHAFTSLERDEHGVARVRLESPDGRRVELWVDGSHPYLMLFTGDPLPSVCRRSLSVEPMTCPPNAFRSGEALIRLEPGESFAGSWGISPS